MASSLVFLGIGIVLFVVVYGILFNVAATILGTVYTVLGSVFTSMNINAEWTTTFNEVDNLSQYLIPMIMSLGIVVFIIKVLMAAGVIGRD